MHLDESQLAAVDFCASSRIALITGSAGTGKTTIIRHLTQKLIHMGREPLLCAFAGKAAARLQQATGFSASTIHRMLKADGIGFQLDSLMGKTVIVDESSMIDSALLAEIVIRKPRQLILVGDAAQLPPVGKGQPFHDLINLRPGLVCELTTCYRAVEAVYRAATEIRSGNMPTAHDRSKNERWDIIPTGNAEKTEKKILQWIKAGSINFETDLILCPRNGGKKGDPTTATVASLNSAIVEIVNPRNGEDVPIQAGDRVINTKNQATLNIWNGTTGTCQAVDIDKGVWVKLDYPIIDLDTGRTEDTVLIPREAARHLQLAYALTVHKAQGSQFRRIIFVCLGRDTHSLIDRALIYTAITRTQEHCVVAGEAHALEKGIATFRPKRTVIQELAIHEVL